jgi:hypothetical protein
MHKAALFTTLLGLATAAGASGAFRLQQLRQLQLHAAR